MAKFDIPVKALRELGVNTDQLIQLLELIHAHPRCTGLRYAIPILLHSSDAFARLVPNIPAMFDLVSLLDQLNQHVDLFEPHLESQDMNAMFGYKYADFPVYSIFTQGKLPDEQDDFAPRFYLATGILLATIWISKEPWHPIPLGFTSFVNNLRKARSHSKGNELSKVTLDVASLSELITSLDSEDRTNTLSHKIRELAENLRDVLAERGLQSIPSSQHGTTFLPPIPKLQDNESSLPPQLDIFVSPQTVATRPPHPNSNPSDVTQVVGKRNYSERKTPSVRPIRNLFQRELSGPNANTSGLAPAMLHVVPLADTPADQPVKLATIQSLEVRYTNYRTAMDNQRLPWVWDCINKFEISALREILISHSTLKDSTVAEKQGAFLIWLILATGQSIEQILRFALSDNQDSYGALLPGPIYRRYIHPPPHGFLPNAEQKLILSSHVNFVDLQLLPPFPSLVSELGLNSSQVEILHRHQDIGSFLQLEAKAADQIVRQFLGQYRTRDLRLLPGRIRSVLGTEIMRVSKDPVITHLLSALPTDMPPSGIYYTAYSEEFMKRIYAEAALRVFGDED